LVYYGTGNPGKDFLGTDRGGDNLYTDSVIALDPMTGKLKWCPGFRAPPWPGPSQANRRPRSR
jgi:glucose dehydrogenase